MGPSSSSPQPPQPLLLDQAEKVLAESPGGSVAADTSDLDFQPPGPQQNIPSRGLKTPGF